MNKTAFLKTALCVLLLGLHSTQQLLTAQVRAMIKVGVNGSTFRGSSDTDFSSITRLSGGVGFSVNIGNGFRIQPEVLYVAKGAKAEGALDFEGNDGPVDVVATFDLTYLEIPILLVYQFESRGIRPQIFAGPTFARKLDARIRYRAAAGGPEFNEEDESVESNDIGLTIGAGFEMDVGSERLSFGLRTSLGFSNARKDNPDAPDNRPLYNTSLGLFAAIIF
ncbi:MAG: PorT family protein [Bacteroidetes bacterium]|nr:MAG: PorT family protein [Bacteroidota bacterium]